MRHISLKYSNLTISCLGLRTLVRFGMGKVIIILFFITTHILVQFTLFKIKGHCYGVNKPQSDGPSQMAQNPEKSVKTLREPTSRVKLPKYFWNSQLKLFIAL